MKSLTKLVLRKSVIVVLACVCGVTAVYFGGQKAEEAVQTLATRPPYEPPTIVLDAGHGGMDGGCTSVNGVSEKGINLEILLHLRAMLQMEGYTVVVTRDRIVLFTKRALRESPIRKVPTWIAGWHCSMNMTRRSVFPFTRINSQMPLTAVHRCSIPAPIGTTVPLHKPCRMHLLPSSSRRINGKLNSAEKNCFSVISAKIQRSWQNAAFYPIRKKLPCWSRPSINRKLPLRCSMG